MKSEEITELNSAAKNLHFDLETVIAPGGGRGITVQSLENFLIQPGINIQGICDEAGIAKQYLNRCRKAKVLPGRKVLDKLAPILKKYGF